MKKLMVIMICLLLCPIVSHADSFIIGDNISFAWNANSDGDLAGYRIYFSDTSGVYIFGSSSPNLKIQILCNGEDSSLECTTYSTNEFGIGTWYFIITAVDLAGQESDPSNELTAVVTAPNAPPSTPTGWRFDTAP